MSVYKVIGRKADGTQAGPADLEAADERQAMKLAYYYFRVDIRTEIEWAVELASS